MMKFTQIEDIEKLEQNWDGLNSPPFDAVVLKNAGVLYYGLKIVGHEVSLVPNSSGSITVLWDFGENNYDIEVTKFGINGFITDKDGNVISDPTEMIKVMYCIKWLMSLTTIK